MSRKDELKDMIKHVKGLNGENIKVIGVVSIVPLDRKITQMLTNAV